MLLYSLLLPGGVGVVGLSSAFVTVTFDGVVVVVEVSLGVAADDVGLELPTEPGAVSHTRQHISCPSRTL